MTESLNRKSSTALKRWSTDYLIARRLQDHLFEHCRLLNGSMLDLGCGNRPYRAWLTNILTYTPYDLDPRFSKPAVVGTAARLPFRSYTFDSVLCTQVLEHVPTPWETVAEISRVMKSDGTLLLSVPQAWRLHEEPHDYYRYTKFGLKYLVESAGMTLEKILPQGGVWVHVGTSLVNHIWVNPVHRKTVAWVTRVIATFLINQFCEKAEKSSRNHADTCNYLLVAKKVR
jgi:SAM-dependent methyltransferase